METQFLDAGGAAEFLKVKCSTIYAWVYQRRIPFRRHGRRLVFHREELESWSKSHSVAVYLPGVQQ
ncbi:MAG: helix-turn-helix domain-containing protein [Bdellovibrionota bacterium]